MKLLRLMVPTSYCYMSADGQAVAEVTWHRVTCWTSSDEDCSKLKKGACVHVVGRLNGHVYVSPDGLHRSEYEIIARSVELIENEEFIFARD